MNRIEIQLDILREKDSYKKVTSKGKGRQNKTKQYFTTSQILLIHFIYAALL